MLENGELGIAKKRLRVFIASFLLDVTSSSLFRQIEKGASFQSSSSSFAATPQSIKILNRLLYLPLKKVRIHLGGRDG